jgi:hypothetical protein
VVRASLLTQGVPSVSVAVVRGDETLVQQAWGRADVASGRAADPIDGQEVSGFTFENGWYLADSLSVTILYNVNPRVAEGGTHIIAALALGHTPPATRNPVRRGSPPALRGRVPAGTGRGLQGRFRGGRLRPHDAR